MKTSLAALPIRSVSEGRRNAIKGHAAQLPLTWQDHRGSASGCRWIEWRNGVEHAWYALDLGCY